MYLHMVLIDLRYTSGKDVAQPVGQRAEAIYRPRDLLPVIIGELVLGITGDGAAHRRVLAGRRVGGRPVCLGS